MSKQKEKKYSLRRWISFLKDLGITQKEIAEILNRSTRAIRDNAVPDCELSKPLHGFSLDEGKVDYLKGLYQKVTDIKYNRTHEGKFSENFGVKKTKLYEDIKRVENNYDEIDYHFFNLELIERVGDNKSNQVKSKLKSILHHYRIHIPLQTLSIFIVNNLLDGNYRRFAELYYERKIIDFVTELKKYINLERECKALDFCDIDMLKAIVNRESLVDKYLIQFKGVHRSSAMDYEMLAPLYNDLLELSNEKVISISEIYYLLSNLKVKYGVNDSIPKKCCRYEGLNLVNDDSESLCLEKGYCLSTDGVRKMISRGGFSRIPFFLMPH